MRFTTTTHPPRQAMTTPPSPPRPACPLAPTHPPHRLTSEATPPPRPLSLPTPAPRRTPTPTPTPPPPHSVLHATPHAPPPQQSPARRQAPCPLLWCLLVGASALTCLPTDAGHRAQDVRKAPVRHPGPAASSAMVALLVVLGAGAAPRAMSAPWNTRVAAHGWATSHNPSACPAHAALSTPADPRARPAPAPRPPQPRPRPADPSTSQPRRRDAAGALVDRRHDCSRRPHARAPIPHVCSRPPPRLPPTPPPAPRRRSIGGRRTRRDRAPRRPQRPCRRSLRPTARSVPAPPRAAI